MRWESIYVCKQISGSSVIIDWKIWLHILGIKKECVVQDSNLRSICIGPWTTVPWFYHNQGSDCILSLPRCVWNTSDPHPFSLWNGIFSSPNGERHSPADYPKHTAFLPLGSGITTVPLLYLYRRVVAVCSLGGLPASRCVAVKIHETTSRRLCFLPLWPVCWPTPLTTRETTLNNRDRKDSNLGPLRDSLSRAAF